MPRLVRFGLAIGLALAALGAPVPARAENDPMVGKAVGFLKNRALAGIPPGESALAMLALLKADVPPGDPAVLACLRKIQARFSGDGYKPEQSGGSDIYEAGVVALALVTLDPEAHRAEIAAIARHIIGKQFPNGCWDYSNRGTGDASISQYAILGLWEAENGGASVSPDVWERAARWYLSAQGPDGSWTYHPNASDSSIGTVSMTAAGVSSLMIAQRQLTQGQDAQAPPSALLTTLNAAEAAAPRGKLDPGARGQIEAAARRGLAWLGAMLPKEESATVGLSPYYALYGLERVGTLTGRDAFGPVRWFDEGRRYLSAHQGADGSWASSFPIECNTAWGVLFLTRSTAKTLQRIEVKRLGAGTLLGGRGLPKDLTSMTVAGGRVVSRPMNGAVEGMLAALEDPRAASADAALSGLVTRYHAEGPSALRPHKARFRALLTAPDPGLRRAAAWSLARTGALDGAPDLIAALTDTDEGVVTVARQGLQLLSRKLDSLGPPSPSTPEQRLEAARRWREWYDSARPLDRGNQDDEDAPPPRNSR